MTGMVLAIAALFSATGVTVAVAPDQPVPHVYCGDPLIIELRSDRDCTVQVDVEIRPDFRGEPVDAHLGGVKLLTGSPRWITIDEAPDIRGRYFIKAVISSEGNVAEHEAGFCRIDRPAPHSATLPVCVNAEMIMARQRLALKTAGVQFVRIDALDATADTKIDAALAAQFQVIVRLRQAEPAFCESLARTWHDRVYCWQIDPGESPETFARMVKAVRAGGSRSRLALVVPDAERLTMMLNAGLGKHFRTVTFDPGQRHESASDLVEAARDVISAAEQAGYERLELQACLPQFADRPEGAGAAFARDALALVAAGASMVFFDASLVADSSLGPAFPNLDAATHLLGGASYVGQLPADDGVIAQVFRTGDRWTAAVWAEQEDTEAGISAGDAAQIEFHDSRNNPLELPPAEEGIVTLQAGFEPVFLSGKGGSILKEAALAEAGKAAAAFASEDIKKHVAKEAVEAIETFAGKADYKRLDFLNLLQAFPYLEEEWHSGGIPRDVAVPAIARLSRLARALCVVEQEKGEAFVEPLQSTLATCGRFQSLYLTGSAGAGQANERPDWLLDEVSKLMAEAETLDTEGRDIEAAAVAALAEWRAQSLELAAKAEPLSIPKDPSEETENE